MYTGMGLSLAEGPGSPLTRSSARTWCWHTGTHWAHTGCCPLQSAGEAGARWAHAALLTAGGLVRPVRAVRVPVADGGPGDTLAVGAGRLREAACSGGPGGGHDACKESL